VIYANASLRASADVLIKNRRGQSGLWGYAISGDLPIVLLQIADGANIDLVRQLVQAHAYWRLKGLAVDLVIWNEDHAGYRQQLQEQIMGLIASGIGASVIDRPGGIFVRQAEQISSEDRILFQSVARAVITDSRGTLAEQLDQRHLPEVRAPRFKPRRTRRHEAYDRPFCRWPAAARPAALQRPWRVLPRMGANTSLTLTPGQVTPAPWVNVLANPSFGTVISESGAAYTWSENAHEFRLTPWHNDPVSDASGEAVYLRDEKTGHFWSPTPLPAPAARPYTTRHGFGYSVFADPRRGHLLGTDGVRGDRRRRQVFGVEVAQRIRPATPAVRHRLCRVGAGGSALPVGDAPDHRSRHRAAARSTRATRTARSSPIALPSSTSMTRRVI
jgi:cyclic beta-1,2-glucan synthetase